MYNSTFERVREASRHLNTIDVNTILNVSNLPYPVGQVLEQRKLSLVLQLSKVTVPFGVIGIIYEARPNVTFDCFALCFKSGNACILKGGSDAIHSNTAIVSIIKKVLSDFSVDTFICELLPAEREATHSMLSARGFVDAVIPRGSRQLIDYVVEIQRYLSLKPVQELFIFI